MFNYDYEYTGPAASLSKALLVARENIISIDGDLLINKNDFIKFIEFPDECVPVANIKSIEPILATVKNKKIISFSKNIGNFEWPGIAKIKKDKLNKCDGYIYEMIEPLLPLNTMIIRTRGIDTPEDYEEMLNWINSGYSN